MRKIMKICLILVVIAGLASCAQKQVETENIDEKPVDTADFELAADDVAATENSAKEAAEIEEIEIPSTFDVDVPFASQAPFANWDLPYQEACEEASLIMAYKYFANEPLNKQIMDNEIKKIVDWQLENLGYYTDTTLDEVAYIAAEYFNLEVEITEEITIENIKKQLILGNLIVAPASGRDLDNPNFTSPGPIFRMLVIRGYDRNEFITNDPGTRNGLKFKYKYDNLIESIHDLGMQNDEAFRPYELKNMSDTVKLQKMRTGPQRMLIVKGVKNK